MGTIKFEEMAVAGTVNQRDIPIPKLDSTIKTTIDATTSTTAESIVLQGTTRIISVYAVETHRVSIGADTTSTNYLTINALERRDIGVDGGKTLYYRLDA